MTEIDELRSSLIAERRAHEASVDKALRIIAIGKELERMNLVEIKGKVYSIAPKKVSVRS